MKEQRMYAMRGPRGGLFSVHEKRIDTMTEFFGTDEYSEWEIEQATARGYRCVRVSVRELPRRRVK